jgi:hypothetical protein
MTPEEIEKIDKAVTLELVYKKIVSDPSYTFRLMEVVEAGLRDSQAEFNKKNSNLWLIVKNLKPEYLEEMKKLIIPEVFESLGIEVE